MPYADGNKPRLGDRVRLSTGEVGTVDDVELDAGNSAGKDLLTIESDDGCLAQYPAAECTLIRRMG